MPDGQAVSGRQPRTRTRTSSCGPPCPTSPRCSSSSRPRRGGPAPRVGGGGTERRRRHPEPRFPLHAAAEWGPRVGVGVWLWGMRGRTAAAGTHLLRVLLLDLLQVGPQVHAHLVLGAQQRLEHGVRGHAHASQWGPLELAPQVEELLVHVFQLQGAGSGRSCTAEPQPRPGGPPAPYPRPRPPPTSHLLGALLHPDLHVVFLLLRCVNLGMQLFAELLGGGGPGRVGGQPPHVPPPPALTAPWPS